MHGRIKERSTAEQAQRKKLEREKKLQIYKSLMNQCLAKIKSKDYDLNGLKLSADILANNGDIQTLWNFRKNIIESNQVEITNREREASLKNETNTQNECDKEKANESVKLLTKESELLKILKSEMHLTECALKNNPKSYGSWYHRQWCLLKAHSLNLGFDQLSWTHELELCNQFLVLDDRNFHCWKHRYFVVKNGNISKSKELEFTYEKICTNFSNYSSWHYRSKLIEALYNENQIDADIFKRELDLIENALFTDPNDQSAWIYEKWLLLEHQRSIIKELTFDANTSNLKFQFAKEINLNNDLIHIKLNNIYLDNSKLNWKNEDGKESTNSFTWQENIINVNDAQANIKIKHLINQLQSTQNYLKVEISIRQSGASNDLLLKRVSNDQENRSMLFEFKSRFDMKNIRLDNELIEKHLENIIELSKLEEGNSKWCLLTTIELMCITNFEKFKNIISDNLDKLANEIDTYRKNFYLDLKQKIISNNS